MWNIVFDIGNVLLRFEPERFLQDLFGPSAPCDHYRKIVFGSRQWVELDRGTIDLKEAAQQIVKQWPEDAEAVWRIIHNWLAMLTPIEPTVALLRDLKQRGYPLYVLSNFHREAYAHIRATYNWLNLFDGLVISAQEGTIKPEPRIYQLLLDRFALDPAQTVFIDDMPENLQGAQRFGIRTIQYRSSDQLISDLGRILEIDLNS